MALPTLNIAKYTTTIPSLGKEVEYRPYLVKEEKILMIAMESKDQRQILRALKDVINSCIYDDIDISKLAVFDLETLFLVLRGKSVGESTEVKARCTECNAENNEKIVFEDINPPVVGDKIQNTIELTDEVGLTLRYPSVTSMEKQNSKSTNIDQMMDMIVDSIDSIYDADNIYSAKDSSKKELKDFIDSLNNAQFKKITAFYENIPALTYDLEFKCVKCEHENKIELRGFDSFFG